MNQARLLIVEDEGIVAADLEDRLTQLGFAVTGIAANGERALALAEQFQPDLVLMDIRLQGEPDGIEVARELRARWRLPIVFLTASSEDATVERAKLAEPYGYLLKPFEHRELAVTIELALYKHQAERKLRASEEHHRSVLQTAMDGIWLADMQGRLLEVNAAYCRMSGYSEQELLALGISDLEAVESADDVAAHNQKTIAQGEDRFETRHRRKDGSIYDVEVSAQYQPVAGGQLVAFLRDITERKRLAAEVRESELRYRMVAEFTYDWEYWLAVDGGFIYVSPSCERITGYRAEEFQQDPELLIRITHPDDRSKLAVHLHDHKPMPSDSAPFELDFRIITRSGETRWINHACQRVYGRDGQFLGRRGSNRDITERVQAEAALRKAEAEYRTLTENLPVGIVVHDVSTVILFSNGSASHLLGLTEDQLRGKTSLDPAWRFLREDGTEMPLAEYPVHQVLSSSGRIADHVLGVCRPDLEKPVWLLCNAYPVCEASGQLLHVVVTFADITERKLAEAALREKLTELERMNRLMIGRETRMIELKREINELCRQLNLPKRYWAPDSIEAESKP